MPKTIADRIVNFDPTIYIPAPLYLVLLPFIVTGAVQEKTGSCPSAEKETAARQSEVKKDINEQLSLQGTSEKEVIVGCGETWPQSFALAYAKKSIEDQIHTTFDDSKALMQSCKKFGININSCCIAYQKNVSDEISFIDVPEGGTSDEAPDTGFSTDIPDAGISGGTFKLPPFDDF